MVQFIGYNVEGGSGYHRGGGGYMDGWHDTSLLEETVYSNKLHLFSSFLLGRTWGRPNQFVLPTSGFPCFHPGLD